MNDSIGLVKVFHEVFQNPILENPIIPISDRVNLRLDLLEEELGELRESIEDKNIVGVADAFGDLLYVLLGSILEFGLGDVFEDIFQEIHNSNMSKSCNSLQEAEETITWYLNKGVNAYYRKINDNFIVFRKEDNKNLKSINYTPPQIKNILDKIPKVLD